MNASFTRQCGERIPSCGSASPSASAPAPRQRLAFDVGHDEVDQVAALLDQVNRDDVGVRQTGRGARFAEKAAPDGGVVRQTTRQQLDRDGTLERQVPGQEDHPHPAPPQLPLMAQRPATAACKAARSATSDNGLS